jgi:hypothetical protein
MEISDGNRTLFPHNPVEFIYVQAVQLVLRLRYKRESVSLGTRAFGAWRHTWRNVIVGFNGDIVGEFGEVDVLENRKPLADRRNTNLLE